jgi:choline dehydrogenase-like flavoprotein
VNPFRIPDPKLTIEDGSQFRSSRMAGLIPWTTITRECDVVVVGSGPAGAAAARQIAKAGASVIVVEEGGYYTPDDFQKDGYGGMAQLWRGLGATVSVGAAPMPFLQGVAVGGTSLINGSICWRLPRDIYEHWLQHDRGLERHLPWDELTWALDDAEQVLNVTPTDPAIAGPKNLLMKKGADALGLENQPMNRNTKGCRGLGRCMQGCPEGHKMSADRSLLPEACEHGATVLSWARVDGIETHNGRATAVFGETKSGARFRVKARRAVVVAASAIQTPALLIRSGIKHGPVGDNLMAHPGAGVRGRFDESVRVWVGATQGHEVTGLKHEGLKFDALGMDVGLAAMRHKGYGKAFMHELVDLEHWAHWGGSIEAEARGTVRPGLGKGGVTIRYSLTKADVTKIRRSVSVCGEMMLAAGAQYVEPGIPGWPQKLHTVAELRKFAEQGPLDAAAYQMIASHMFGTARMGTQPGEAVVGGDFQHHKVAGLYIADSSVFPTNTGVNPMLSIVALATLCGKRVAQA